MVDDRQFIIVPSSLKDRNMINVFPHDRQRELALPSGLMLVYEKHLHVCYNEDCTAVLIGDAWQVHPSKDCPESIIKSFTGRTTIEDVYHEEKTWCGRYVLIVNNWLFLDFAGTLGVFYSDDMRLSSSYRILCEQIGTEVIYPDTLGEGLMNFVPGPLTPTNGVMRLLPSEIINIATGERRTRPLNPDGIWNAENDQDRINILDKYFSCSLRNMAKHFSGSTLWLALTGGIDSRALMALLESAGIEYKAFTCWHDHISEGDQILPRRLANAVHVPYKFIEQRQENYSANREEEYRKHTGGMANDGDKPMYVHGQYQELNPEHQAILLRSAIWGCPRNYYKSMFSRTEVIAMEKCFDATRVFAKAKKHELYNESLRQWEGIVKNDALNKNISLWNRLMIDIRQGAWLSSIEQGFDMMDGIISIECCNSRLFFSIQLGFSEKDLLSKKHEMNIVKQLCPILSKYRYQYNLTLKKRIRNVLHELKMRYS